MEVSSAVSPKGKIVEITIYSLGLIEIQKDSILKNEYVKIKKILKSNNYSLALKLALSLYKKSEKEFEVHLLISYLIGEILEQTINHDKSLLYYKESLNLYLNKNRIEIFTTCSQTIANVHTIITHTRN